MAPMLGWALVATLAAAQQPQVLVVGGPTKPAAAAAAARAHSSAKARLETILRKDVIGKLPVGARLVRIEPDVPVQGVAGPLHVDVDVPEVLQGGMQYASATVRAGDDVQQIPVRLTIALLTAQGRLAPIIKRGSDVMVIVRTGNVFVQSMGVAQENGGIEQPISVIPNASGRIIRGRVKDARTVEVAL